MTATKTRTESRQMALERLGAAFKGVMAGTRRLRGRETQRHDELSFAQFHLLFGLAGEGELSTTRLAVRADLSPATVTQMLAGLEAMGLVERTRSAQDRRVVMCSLTERGATVTAAKRADWEARWKSAMSEFTIDELATATAVLERLGELFEEIDDG